MEKKTSLFWYYFDLITIGLSIPTILTGTVSMFFNTDLDTTSMIVELMSLAINILTIIVFVLLIKKNNTGRILRLIQLWFGTVTSTIISILITIAIIYILISGGFPPYGMNAGFVAIASIILMVFAVTIILNIFKIRFYIKNKTVFK